MYHEVRTGGVGASWTFLVPPARSRASSTRELLRGNQCPVENRQDTDLIEVRLTNAGDMAELWVKGEVRARAPRDLLRSWFLRRGVKPEYATEGLTLKYAIEGIWIELAGCSAPALLTRPAVRSITQVLNHDRRLG